MRAASPARRTVPAREVFLNGRWVGVHQDPNDLESILRELRRRKDLESEVPAAVSCARNALRTLLGKTPLI